MCMLLMSHRLYQCSRLVLLQSWWSSIAVHGCPSQSVGLQQPHLHACRRQCRPRIMLQA